ncbi:hypothetical protein UP09_05635 [Bradyrhizobium sp. LTSP885]|nr:hypothetical protein UP09_05635 [Bradyrhizobium sp. LTSP885]
MSRLAGGISPVGVYLCVEFAGHVRSGSDAASPSDAKQTMKMTIVAAINFETLFCKLVNVFRRICKIATAVFDAFHHTRIGLKQTPDQVDADWYHRLLWKVVKVDRWWSANSFDDFAEISEETVIAWIFVEKGRQS